MWILLVLISGSAFAEGQRWSVVGPKTIEPGANAMELGAGWPGISVSYLRGFASGFNAGLKVGFDYGLEGLVSTLTPGAKAQVVLKFRLVDAEKFSLGISFDPGVFLHTSPGSSTVVGVSFPIGLRVGYAASSAFQVAALIEVPLWFQFGSGGGLNIPVLTGIGAEYFLSSQILAFGRVQVGPTIRPNGPAEVSLLASVGVGLKL
jgi:hypothetical protein